MRRWRRVGPAAVAAAVALSCGALQSRNTVRRELWGFTAPWDARSQASVVRNGGRLDALVTGWVALDSTSGEPRFDLFTDSLSGGGASGVSSARRMMLVTSWLGDRFHPSSVRALARDNGALQRAALSIAARAAAGGYRGLVLDLEMLSPADVPALAKVVGAIGTEARKVGVSPIAIAVPATDTVAYPGELLASLADYLVVMLYDEHWSSSPPGPISSPDWVRRALGVRVAEVGPNRIVAALPFYGYQWRQGQPARTISYDDALQLATSAGQLLEREPASETLHARRPNEWELWVTDAELLRTLIREAESAGVTRFAFWYVGLEDPRFWRQIPSRSPPDSAIRLLGGRIKS